jgi:hypothetical protein
MQPRGLLEAKDEFERRVPKVVEDERAFLEKVGRL